MEKIPDVNDAGTWKRKRICEDSENCRVQHTQKNVEYRQHQPVRPCCSSQPETQSKHVQYKSVVADSVSSDRQNTKCRAYLKYMGDAVGTAVRRQLPYQFRETNRCFAGACHAFWPRFAFSVLNCM